LFLAISFFWDCEDFKSVKNSFVRQLLRERIFLELYRLLDFGGLHADKRALESGAFLILAGKWFCVGRIERVAKCRIFTQKCQL